MDIGHATIKEITNNLKKIYCSTIGAEFMHITAVSYTHLTLPTNREV